jgi:hypothetical protein
VWSARGNAARRKEGGGIGATEKKGEREREREREREEAGVVRGRGQRALRGKERENGEYVISNKRRGDRS